MITEFYKRVLFLFFISTVPFFVFGKGRYWNQVDDSRVNHGETRMIDHSAAFYYELDLSGFAGLLRTSTEISAGNSRTGGVVVSVPGADGKMQEFRVFVNSVVPELLQKKYPEIMTFSAQGVTDPFATARFDLTYFGFHGMVLTPKGSYFIDPVSRDSKTLYQVYYKKNASPVNQHRCKGITDDQADEILPVNYTPSSARMNGDQLKTYRLAMACTGEYSIFHGGTKPSALSAIVTSVNRVGGIYEREFAVNFNLVPNTDTLIFLDPNTDPYTNNNGGAMLGQNQTVTDILIGSSNYDMGHVFSTGGGGIAGLGVICKVASKARGVTGLNFPVGDPFDVDYVAHEMGHQFGGNHTFNAESGACNGNRAFTAAYEPGSGSTIMAYAGICGFNNLQSNSDDYFHSKSFDEVMDYITINAGMVCPVVTPTGNTPPAINPGGNYIIPYLTPFRLTGSATDPDGDSLTYCWEQYDLGPAGNWNSPTGNAPIFRSFDPTPDPVRYFPRLLNIITGITSTGEVLPSYARNMEFKLTVRDNRAGGGGVTNNDTPVQIQVINTGSPFEVTSQNTAGIQWNPGTQETVTWDVASTDMAPINTPTVNILLSLDGGYTYPNTLATGVTNNGSYTLTVPWVFTTKARIMVEGNNNIFFDINDEDFQIGTVGIGEPQPFTVAISPNPVDDEFYISILDWNEPFIARVHDMAGKIVYEKQLSGNKSRVDFKNFSPGIYVLRCELPGSVMVSRKLIKF